MFQLHQDRLRTSPDDVNRQVGLGFNLPRSIEAAAFKRHCSAYPSFRNFPRFWTARLGLKRRSRVLEEARLQTGYLRRQENSPP